MGMWEDLDWVAQLNCYCNAKAKQIILQTEPLILPSQQPFLLEPLCIFVFVDGAKMTSDTGGAMRFIANEDVARDFYQDNGILSTHQFNVVDWYHVHRTMNEEVPILNRPK